jgi:hypothetical protein
MRCGVRAAIVRRPRYAGEKPGGRLKSRPHIFHIFQQADASLYPVCSTCAETLAGLDKTMALAGFDVARYPGDRAMRWLWDKTNLYWVGYYLAVGGSGYADKTWSGRYPGLKTIGWGVAPIYVGKQRASPKLAQLAPRGTAAELASVELNRWKDGVEAVTLALAEAMPPGLVIYYFDYEGGDQPHQRWLTYFWGWIQGVMAFRFKPGLYCSHKVVNTVMDDVIKRNSGRSPSFWPEIWCVNISSSNPALKDLKPKNVNGIVEYPTPFPRQSGSP